MVVKIAMLVIFFVVMICVGLYCRKKIKDVGDFVLGGRTVGPWLTAFAYGTSYFSAVVFIGYAGQFGWNFGFSAVWIGIGNAFLGSYLAWKILGGRTRVMTHHLDSTTMPEFFEKIYDSKALKLVSSLIIFVFLVPYSASVYKGLSVLFENAFGISFYYCIIGMAILTAAYIILGGYMATAINDFIQGIVMIVGITLVIAFVMKEAGGFSHAFATMKAIEPKLVAPFGPSPINLVGVIILTSLGTWGMPQMVHKFYAIKDKKSIKIGTTIATLFAIVIAGGSYFMGSFGRAFNNIPMDNGKPIYDMIVPTMLQKLPDLMVGVVIVLVLSASMSTLSSLVLASSSTLILDFVKGTIVKDLSKNSQMFLIRLFCGLFVAASVLVAIIPGNLISTLMSISWGAIAGSFLAPFMYGLFWKGVTRTGVWAGFATGVMVTTLNSIFLNTGVYSKVLQGILTPPNVGALAMLLSLIIVPLVSLATPKLSKAHVDKAFECFEG